ncbi:MAG TPA: 4'-phosphopantetheinyl transferase superfamily protein [Puia sp.]|uniref:4'-phosphopantetheinyl transferase superfamily protein n=1 Tax=Puia sp. TaxID=2045100 RepID=UPI002CCE60D6|nr:4'-phosphopantetheinyl transferase superfamily protein [Puia sp.]HVU98953.1 4'-phosphopantetheinyl transferase superfamily protein [Puia sp.]
MEEIKQIIAAFIKVPAEQIGPATPIDRRAVKSSIMLHRMYARLAEAGLVITDYASIRIFSDLGNGSAAALSTPDIEYAREPAAAEAGDEPLTMGIDIESVSSLPQTADFRRDEFYKQNFTPQEMAWCILQPEPVESFAGLFAAKEALIKADNSLREIPFNQIAIGRSPQGKPLYPGFTLSIAHSNGTAVAVAARAATNGTPAPVTLTEPPAKAKTGRAIVWLALLLATAALILSLWHAK